jgi:hypothetical protein
VGETTIVAVHGSRANRAGSFLECMPVRLSDVPARLRTENRGRPMPRGRSTFTKRQKEHTRQQRQRDKAERRNQRRHEKPVESSVDEVAELHEHAAAQAALFNIGREETKTAQESDPDDRRGK